jgi:DNA-binding transcriptional ArsR family regulator
MSNKKTKRKLTDSELEQVALRFRLLGEPMRLKILEAVCREPRSVSEIVTATGATQANISKHLSLLATAGILSRQKRGQSVYYGMRHQLTVKLCELVYEQLVD